MPGGNLELEQEYAWYCDNQTDYYLDPAEVAAIRKNKLVEMQEQHKGLPRNMIEDLAGQATRQELRKRTPLITIEGFAEMRRRDPDYYLKPARLMAPVATRLCRRDGQTYVWVPPGVFLMGASLGDFESFDDEKPLHRVTISRGFWMGRTPVTDRAYKSVMEKRSGNALSPASGVTFEEARQFAKAIGMRLPPEAEWEWAARGGTASPRYAPSLLLQKIAFFDGFASKRPVAQKRPNAYGLYDMIGNVWEWVAD
jgi:formylglycine-generating enzyme required for sulfatase activity